MTSPAGIPSPTDPDIRATIARWVEAAGAGFARDNGAAALAAVVMRVADARGVAVDFAVEGAPVEADRLVTAVEVPDAVLGRVGPWLPGFLREALLAADARRRGGVHHTSPAMAGTLVDFVADLCPFDDSTVVADPAVGGGVFLLAAAERLSGEGRERVRRLQGFDIDPLAVAVTEAALRLWADGEALDPGAIRVADGLSSETFIRRPDVIIGNPPFLSQLRDDTTRGERRRAEIRRRWPDVGGYVDDAAAFLLASVDRVGRGGVVALVQPSSFLSARDAAPVRARLAREAPPIGVWIDGDRQFDAAVDTVAVVVQKGAEPGVVQRITGVPAVARTKHSRPLDSASWAPLLVPDSTPSIRVAEINRGAVVGDVARVTAGFRDHFYGLRGAVSEDPAAEHRLITSGLIDPLESRWGRAPCRFDGVKWEFPSVDPDAVAPGIQAWIADRLRPKLLIASQTKIIEVIVDLDGSMVPCTPVVSVEPTPGAPSLAHLGAALSSPIAAALLLAETAGSALSRDAMRVSAATIAALPLPPPGQAWDVAAAALDALAAAPDRADVIAVGRLAMEAYGLGDRDDLLNWWEPRLPRR